jgi:bloom syndrome protein
MKRGVQTTLEGFAKRQVISLVDDEDIDIERTVLLTEALRRVFGFKDFRENQLNIMLSIMSGKDTLAVLSTGKGKSLCFQLPAIISPGKMVVVISPLLSLMADQINHLEKNKIHCRTINSLKGVKDTRHMFTELDQQDCRVKLLYISPETLESDAMQKCFQKLYARNKIAFMAIDEAHCVSTWGHDFRKAYQRLRFIRSMYPKIPFLALTATASLATRHDIIKTLNFNPNWSSVFIASFDRPEIFFSVRERPNGPEFPWLAESIRGYFQGIKSGCAIVYCVTIADTEGLAACLRNLNFLPPEQIQHYHGKLKKSDRLKITHGWQTGVIRILCATSAFGMGIDKPDVRFVFHKGPPRTLEDYYQESGRAGRDGLPAKAILFYTPGGDSNRLKQIIRFQVKNEDAKNRLLASVDKIIQYCELKSCRRSFLLSHFEEAHPQCNTQSPPCCN